MTRESEASPNAHEAMSSPPQTSIAMTWPSQPPPRYETLDIMPPPIVISPGIFVTSQLGQGNIQILNPMTATPATKLSSEATTLGAIQIITGLMHIGFGVILGSIGFNYGTVFSFASITFLSGFPFWGGLSFIVAGMLPVCTYKDQSPCLIKSILVMNIFSAIISFIGVILLLVDEGINPLLDHNYWAVVSGRGISAMLIIFSFLEFCVAFATAYLAKQAVANPQRPVTQVSPVIYTLPVPPPYTPSTNAHGF